MRKRIAAIRRRRWWWIAVAVMLILTNVIGTVPSASAANADGSLTVAEAIASNSGTKTVEGYIVGHATGSLTAKFTAPFANDFNFLIADSANESSSVKLLDVQLTAAYRAEFGLQTNPSLIGRKVKVTGTLGAYNNYAGLKSPTSIVWVGNGTTTDPTDPTDPTDSLDPVDPIPVPELPDGTGKKVLFDHAHAQTAGAADWVIDGAFSDFADALKADGFTVESLDRAVPFTFGEQAITYDKLKNYDVFIIGEANVPFKTSEQAAMLQYVNGGGSIFFISDHYNADRNKNRWDSSEVMNGYRRGAWDNPAKGMSAAEASSPAMQDVQSSDWLANNFGIRFRYNALGDVDHMTDVVAPNQAFGITSGVTSVAMHAGSTLAIIDPAKAKGIVYAPANVSAWANAVDSGVYNGGGREEGPFAAVSKLGAGKAAFIGDSSPVEDATPKYLREENGSKKTTYDGFLGEADDATFLVQTVEWLAHKESYTSLNQVAGLQLDQPTQLLAYENPAQSTEPQAEPWAAPEAGYKWYDPTTFKPGSYGSTSQPASNPQFAFVHQSTLPNAGTFQVRVTADNLLPGQTIMNLSAGIYLTGGTQVAKVQNSDGTWPSSYGYSSAFSLTADATGHAYRDLNVQLHPSASGAANLRLRLNGTNQITKAVTIGDVPVEPLPEDHPPVPERISIAAVRQATDSTLVTAEGVITSEPGLFGGQGFYLQDDTAAIYVYQTAAGYHAGDKISVSAVKTTYNTELELVDPVILDVIGTASTPAPVVQSSLNEGNQGQLVTLENVTVTNYITAAPAGSFEFDAVNGEGSTHVRIDARTGIGMAGFQTEYPAGSVVNVTGISAIFKGVYQLKPLADSHVVHAVPADTTAPTATVAYSTTAPTNEAVVATITPSEPVTVTNNGGSLIYTFAANGSFTFEFTDAAGNTGSATATVGNIVTAAPSLTLVVDRPVIDSNNHKMVPVQVTVDVNGNSSSVSSIVLASITSNEPDNGQGDGNTTGDIQDAEYGTFDTSFSLRAERSGNGTGRIYTITYIATDVAGNTSTASVQVLVPKGNGK